jgi:hypothetical protein
MIHDVPCGVRAFELASKMLKPTIGRQKNKKTVRVDGKNNRQPTDVLANLPLTGDGHG